MKSHNADVQKMRVKLIFNPISGENSESPMQLLNVIEELQAWNFIPEIYLIKPDCDLNKMIEEAKEQGISMFIVCGGDGTISSVAKYLIDTDLILGIIPIGTQNNVALSLGIPTDIKEAAAILRKGRNTKVDTALVTCGGKTTAFIEVCSVGLFSNLFQSGDDIQHGDISRIGEFLTTLTSTLPSEIQLWVNNKKEIKELGHVVLISNMPYVGRHYKVGSEGSYDDGFLDVLLFADLTKLDLLGFFLKASNATPLDDPRVKHYRAKNIKINTHPAMQIMADGIILGEGAAEIEVKRHTLSVMLNS